MLVHRRIDQKRLKASRAALLSARNRPLTNSNPTQLRGNEVWAKVFRVPSPANNPIACHERASDWMHRGIGLLQENGPVSWHEAVRCFDEAIALRRTMPLAQARHRYNLAAGWMNRGDALARLGGKEHLAESVKSYDEALILLRDLPLDEDPLYLRRLAIAWINRGFTRQNEETATAHVDALRCFREAIGVLDDHGAAGIDDLPLLRAGALTNLAGALLDTPDASAAESCDAARKALQYLQDAEPTHIIAAEAGFKARHVLCRAIAAESRDGKSIPPELVAEAARTVDAGLALARRWERQGESGFRWLAEDLFRFGCRIHQMGQPHFLTKFILESLDPEMTDGVLPLNHKINEAAVAALWSALKEIQHGDFESFSTLRFEQILESLRDLRVTEDRLEQLRRTTFPGAKS